MAAPAFLPKQQIIYFQGGKDYANERNKSLLSNCRVQLIFCKDYANRKQNHQACLNVMLRCS